MLALALILLFAASDRFAGGGLWDRLTVDHGGPLHGRPVWYAFAFLAVALGGLGALAGHGVQWAWIALPWLIWREPRWGLFGGSLTPETLGQAFGFWLRHCLFLGFVVAASRLEADIGRAVAAVLIWAAAAAGLGVWLRIERDRGRDVNPVVETVRGAFQGAAVAWVIAIAR